jgi:hypothetical protein
VSFILGLANVQHVYVGSLWKRSETSIDVLRLSSLVESYSLYQDPVQHTFFPRMKAPIAVLNAPVIMYLSLIAVLIVLPFGASGELFQRGEVQDAIPSAVRLSAIHD